MNAYQMLIYYLNKFQMIHQNQQNLKGYSIFQ